MYYSEASSQALSDVQNYTTGVPYRGKFNVHARRDYRMRRGIDEHN